MIIGPNTTTSGLVLCLDAANIKSFKGEPTTNLITDPDVTSGSSWSVSNYLTSSATATFETESSIPHLKISNIVFTTGYPRIGTSTLTSGISTNFSVSYDAKGSTGSTMSLNFYSSGSTKVVCTATLTNSWQRFTFDNISTGGFTLDQAYIAPLTTGATQYIRRIQAEVKTKSTAYINGTRGATVATGGGWADIAGNGYHAELVNNPTSNSLNGGSLVFNGTDNYVIGATALNINSNITIDAFIYPTSNPSNAGFIISNVGGYYFELKSTGVLRSYFYGLSTEGYHDGTNTITLNKWSHVVLVRDSTSNTISTYINGVVDRTISSITGNISNGIQNYQIGKYSGNGSYNFIGRIASIKVYNRALSISEIQQNYRAMKVRFGLT